MPQSNHITQILRKFMIEPQDLELVRAIGPQVMSKIDEHVEKFYVWLSEYDEYKMFFGSNPDRLQRVRGLQVGHWQSFFDAQIDDAWIESRRHIGAVHAHINLPNDIYFAAMSLFSKLIADQVWEEGSNAPHLHRTIAAVNKLMFLDAYVVVEEIARIQREKIEAGSKALMEMSTPVTPIWEDILLLPLVGVVDSERTQDIMHKTLNKISETRSKVFVLDISGVAMMDTAVANQLMKITRATQLMGCETIISGVSATVARTLVELGINVGEVKTTATLRDSFELALRSVGVGRQFDGAVFNHDVERRRGDNRLF